MSFFQSENMLHVSIYLHARETTLLATQLAKSGYFAVDQHHKLEKQKQPEHEQQPEQDQQASQNNDESNYQQLFVQAKHSWLKVMEYLQQQPLAQVKNIQAIEEAELAEAKNRLRQIETACNTHKDKQLELHQQSMTLDNLFTLLSHFEELDINLALFKQQFEFLDLRLGILPRSYFQRVENSLRLASYSLFVYLQENDELHVIIAGEKQNQEKIQSLLDASSFQALQIPEEFYGHPKQMLVKLEMERQLLVQEQYHLDTEFQSLKKQYAQELQAIGDTLALAKSYVSLSQNMLNQGFLSRVNGWIPKDKLTTLKQYLKDTLQNPVVIEASEPKPENYTKAPSYIVHPKWLTPFERLISNYGVPAYKEFDPSWFFTLSYVLMFGFMFGDIGHGLMILLIGWLLRHKYRQYISFFLAIGTSSFLFGFMYGSIFSFEHVLTPIWISPISDPTLMLKWAFAWGALYLTFLGLVNIYNKLAYSDFVSAIFSPKACSGLLLYFSMLWSVYEMVVGQYSSSNTLMLTLSISIIMVYQFIQLSGNFAERLLTSLIETYEVLISYLSHSLSFLRVAAFTLNHSALAIALFTLASMAEGSWHWFTIIFGNIFILVLEGAIVAIQVLRLEYYEGFSRYFGANGYLFNPLELSPEKLASHNSHHKH